MKPYPEDDPRDHPDPAAEELKETEKELRALRRENEKLRKERDLLWDIWQTLACALVEDRTSYKRHE